MSRQSLIKGRVNLRKYFEFLCPLYLISRFDYDEVWICDIFLIFYKCYFIWFLLVEKTIFEQFKKKIFKLRGNKISWWDAEDINATIICHNDELSSSLAWLVYNSIFWESATRLINKSWEYLDLFINNQTRTELIKLKNDYCGNYLSIW